MSSTNTYGEASHSSSPNRPTKNARDRSRSVLGTKAIGLAVVRTGVRGRKTGSGTEMAPDLRLCGVSDGARTRDNRDHNPVLYQLSYTHHWCGVKSSGHRRRVSPALR